MHLYACFVGLFVRMSYMTIIQGDDFCSVVENKVYKKSNLKRLEVKSKIEMASFIEIDRALQF